MCVCLSTSKAHTLDFRFFDPVKINKQIYYEIK